MEIRGVRESELREMIDLQCAIHNPSGHQRYHQYIHGDSSYRLDQTRVVVVDERIVATMRVWDREMRVGSTPLRMAGVGGVGTHPDHRRQGYAAAMMRDAADWFRSAGYQMGLLFTEIPCRYYAQFGWASVPVQGFAITPRRFTSPAADGPTVEAYDDDRDLDQAARLYAAFNADQSGSIVRHRPHWDTAPARLRDLLPTVVTRRDGELTGYMNYLIDGAEATLLEVAYDHADPAILPALVGHFARECAGAGVERIAGEIPHRHPVVELLLHATAGDLALLGQNSMMALAVDLRAILHTLLPELQSRIAAAAAVPPAVALRMEIGAERCTLELDEDGRLHVAGPRPGAVPLPLPGGIFWRALFGESDWDQLEAALCALQGRIPPAASHLMRTLFPRREVILWTPDHF